MKTILALCLLLLTLSVCGATSNNVFRFSVNSDLERLDPAQLTYSSPISSYPLNAIHAPLMRYQNHKLEPFAAESCWAVTKTQYRCRLIKDLKWSDGQSVMAKEYVNNWEYMKDTTSPRLGEFTGVKSVRALSNNELEVELKSPDSEFLYRLIDPTFSPRKSKDKKFDGKVTIGPYYLKKHSPGRSYLLAPNEHFFVKNPNRPAIEVLIVESDNTALALYNTKKLNFLRRLTAENIPIYKDDPGFMQIPLHRMDYIGINKEVAKNKKLLKDIVYAVQPAFSDFQKLFSALGPPGCVGLVTQKSEEQICLKAKKVTPYSESELKKLPHLKLLYATQGGEDIRRGMELFQNAWKKNLNINVELVPTEWGVMTEMLKKDPPTLFRRGVPLQRPTCLAALEVFESNGLDNFIGVNDKEYDRHVRNLRNGEGNAKVECERGLKRLLELHRVIPMGPLYYTMLNDNQFEGILINELNQLDLSGLKAKDQTQKHR